jgi:hypothetical protein
VTTRRLPAAFYDPAFVWEVKHDGFHGLVYVEINTAIAGFRFRSTFAELE